MLIPYIPNPYPDEILGYFFTRFVICNGTRVWQSLLEGAGYGHRTSSPFVGIPDSEPRFHRLLEALGTTYLDVLCRLTTLPFWLAFNGGGDSLNHIEILGGPRPGLSTKFAWKRQA
jgi:hypothetical protein